MRRKGCNLFIASILILTPRLTAEGLTAADPARSLEAGSSAAIEESADRVIITVTDSRGNALAGVPVTEYEKEGRFTTDAQGQLTLPLEQSSSKGKAILLCLFDLDQRPSRHCLQQLGQKAKELAERGVVTAAVQIRTIDQIRFDEWVKENAAALPVSMTQAVDDRTCEAWGIKSLPWLILTDRQHAVRVEGFRLEAIVQQNP